MHLWLLSFKGIETSHKHACTHTVAAAAAAKCAHVAHMAEVDKSALKPYAQQAKKNWTTKQHGKKQNEKKSEEWEQAQTAVNNCQSMCAY